ncbi:MAG: hypothetical protein PHW52_02300, partial [Candidatus Pacebacteria bacterium]|nr:hypothetical protein [Candidatus Paceibacterota bacterium]
MVRQGGASVTVVSAAETGGAIWFAPSGTTTFTAGTTMTTASGTATSILTPITTGSYKLFVIDAAGNISAASTATLSVDATGPTFTINNGTSGVSVKTDTINISVADANGVNASTVEYGFSANNTCDGSDTYGNAFTSATDFLITGNHNDYLCVMAADNAGNATYQLVGQLHIDNTAPTNQDTVFASSLDKKGGASVTVVSAAETGGSIWFAPAGTTTFTAGTTMTTASGTATSILAPATAGSYKLFVIDAAGNLSAASTATLTVDNTAPDVPVITSIASDNKINNAEKGTISIVGTSVVGAIITATLTDSNTPTPHSVTGTATAGAGGAYTVVLNGTSLNDGNISVSVYASDTAGNDSAAVTTPSATKDIVVPTISTNQTQDLDGDGKIDALKITFSKNIVDSTVNPVDFDVSGYVGEAFSSTTNGDIAN